MKNISDNEILSNKLSQILETFPADRRRNDGKPNPSNVRLIQVLVNLILNRAQTNHGDLASLKGTQRIGFCLQGDVRFGNTGWQGVIQTKYPDVNSGIDALRAGVKLIQAMGGVVWESQGRYREGVLYCDIETLLLIDQACMVLLDHDLEPVRGELSGDEQLSAEYWNNAPSVANPLRSSLKWVGIMAKRVFGALPRKLELVIGYCVDKVRAWDNTHRITVPPRRKPLPECEIGFSWVSDYWLNMGDSCT